MCGGGMCAVLYCSDCGNVCCVAAVIKNSVF